MRIADQPGSDEPHQFGRPAGASSGMALMPQKEDHALEPETIGIITAVTVYIARVVRSEMVRWRSRARGTDSETRALQLLENIDRSLTTHHTEMTRYQASIADSLGQIKGRLAQGRG